MNPGISPIAFSIGPWPVHWYGIIFAFVIILGVFVSYKQAQYYGENADLLWDGVLLVVLCGIIGSRLYHVIDQWEELYKNNLLGILYVWNGGLAIYGGLAGGLVGMMIFSRMYKLNIWRWLDIVVPAVALGQAIGRWGNFVNREMYGRPTDVPWALYIEPQYRVAGYEGFSHFHPLFLYESVWNLGVFVTLMILSRSKRPHLREGDIFLLYLILYSLGRSILESVKVGQIWTIGGFRTAQLIAFTLIIVCSLILAFRHWRRPAQASVISDGQE